MRVMRVMKLGQHACDASATPTTGSSSRATGAGAGRFCPQPLLRPRLELKADSGVPVYDELELLKMVSSRIERKDGRRPRWTTAPPD